MAGNFNDKLFGVVFSLNLCFVEKIHLGCVVQNTLVFSVQAPKTIRKSAELLLGNFQPVVRFIWPLILSIFQTFVQEKESRFIQKQTFDAVSSTAAGQINMISGNLTNQHTGTRP